MSDTDLVFDGIEISGFMSFPPKVVQKLDLNTNRLTAIIGENIDTGHGDRNGAGKSAMLDALLYLYFGKTLRLPSNQSLINYIEPGPLFVTGTARRAGTAFRVERGENPSCLRLFEKLDHDVRDWYTKEDGKFLFEATKSTKPETTKRIAELIGFDIKLTDILLFNNSSDKSCFFLKSEEDQRNAVERIFGFTVFTEKADRLRDLRKDENKNLVTKEAALIATKQANDRILAQIQSVEEKSDAWATQHDKTARFLAQQITTYEGIKFQSEIETLTQIDVVINQIAELQRDVQKVEQTLRQTQHRQRQWQEKHTNDLSGLAATLEMLRMGDPEADIQTLNQVKELRDELAQIQALHQTAKHETQTYDTAARQEHTNRDRVTKQIGLLEKQLIQLAEQKCPTCGQEWHENEDHIRKSIKTLEDHTEELDGIDNRLGLLGEKWKTVQELLNKHEVQITILNEKIRSLPKTTFKTVEDAAAVHTRLAELTLKHEQEQQAVNPHDEPLQQLAEQYEMIERELQSLHEQVKDKPETYYASLADAQTGFLNFEQIQRQFDDLQQSENPYRETIDDLRTKALKPVDETEIQALKHRVEHMSLLITLLADRDSPIRKAVLNEWLPELNNRVNHYLEVLELSHRIAFDPNMTATFTVTDKTLSFGNLSKGQKLRVWMATNLGFREIFELINYRINLFWVDEVLDNGLSSRGSEVSYRVLERMVQEKKSVFLITHRQELADIADNTISVILENGLSTIAA